MAHSSIDSTAPARTAALPRPDGPEPQVLRGLVTAMIGYALATAAEETEKQRHLPLPPWGYALLAMAVFFALFAVTWSFRSIGTRH